ncbi:MAG: 23S rRNA (uracil(1939)-C(5))-methyltransferase RlmD, partial [Patescibacteria group bacterium]
MHLKKGTEVTVRIERLVFGGRGIGDFEGRKVFVDHTVPGDEVKVRLTRIKPNYAEAKLVEVVKPSEDRVKPRCKHFDTCGGCSWQFLPYEKQCEVKEQQVRDALERIGRLNSTLVEPLIPCEEPWFYRNKMELSFGADENGKAMLGFYPPGYHFEVFDLEECFLESEEMPGLVKDIRDFAHEFDIKPFNKETHEGVLRNLVIREGKNSGERMLILLTQGSNFDRLKEFKKRFEKDPRITSLYWTAVHQVPGKRTFQEAEHLAGKETVKEILHLENGSSLEFEILPEAFFQTNTKQTEVLYSKVLELAELSGDETVLDLYSGTGTIGLFCAHKAGKVIGIEINEDAVESAIRNAQRNRIENVNFILGKVEDELPPLKGKTDLIIVDPPRSGLGPEVTEVVASFEAKKIVYVSCNPSTLARDLQQFAALGYACRRVIPIDLFPQTSHVECVCVLEKN